MKNRLLSLCDTFSIRSLFRPSVRSSKKTKTGLYDFGLYKFAMLMFCHKQTKIKKVLIGANRPVYHNFGHEIVLSI